MEFNEKLAEVFRVLDRDDNKTIPVNELAKGLRAAGLNPTESQLHQFKAECVVINEDQIDFPEFQKIAINCKEANLVTKEEVLNYFQSFDTQNENYLSLLDLTQALCSSGDKLEARDVEVLLKDFDKDGSGKVNIKEFVDGIFKV